MSQFDFALVGCDGVYHHFEPRKRCEICNTIATVCWNVHHPETHRAPNAQIPKHYLCHSCYLFCDALNNFVRMYDEHLRIRTGDLKETHICNECKLFRKQKEVSEPSGSDKEVDVK